MWKEGFWMGVSEGKDNQRKSSATVKLTALKSSQEEQ